MFIRFSRVLSLPAQNLSAALLVAALIAIPTIPAAAAGAESKAASGSQPSTEPGKKLTRFERLLQRAKAGDSSAQYTLAFVYGPPRNRISAQEAFAFLEQSASAGNLHGLAELGMWQVVGKGAPVDTELGLANLEKAGKLGHPNGYFVLGAIYGGQAKRQVAPDPIRAIHYYEACIDLLDKAAVDKRTVNYYVRQCLTNLGRHHLQGDGTRKDLYRARALFQQAADMGEPIGMSYLAFRMLNGEGGSQDREAAITWFRKSAAAGNKTAAKALASLGVETASDPDAAKTTARQAAAARKKRPKYILYAFMARANERQGLQKFKPGHVNIHADTLSGRPESEIFHGMLLQNIDFLNEKFIGPGTPYGFESRGEMRNAMVDSYDPNDPYRPMKVTRVGHEVMDALASHMKLDNLVKTIARNANKRRDR